LDMPAGDLSAMFLKKTSVSRYLREHTLSYTVADQLKAFAKFIFGSKQIWFVLARCLLEPTMRTVAQSCATHSHGELHFKD
jgi:hypothetical protein